MSRSSASFSACLRCTCWTLIGASITFSMAVLCGNRLKRWKTMPMEARCLATSRAFISCSTLPRSL